ncbi:MAG: hypothetical protein JSW61_05865 [Candidatus Thorarchaeota archaeon]|nr:MAG: hypothetical protein JSW61_05865 [Candidatus Thorarchaeota archaeon]
MSSSSGAAQIRALADEILQEESFRLEGPICHESVSLIPIVTTEEVGSQPNFMNAAEALSTGVLQIIEGGDSVELIIAQNMGQIPILIEEGEVLKADGSQDRIVVTNIVIQPGDRIRIPVKCVHAPHALHAGSRFRSIGAGSYNMRAGLKRAKYQSIMTDVEHYTPEHAVDQSEVWESARLEGVAAGTADPTKYTKALEKQRKSAEKTAKKFRKEMPERTCGFIAVDSKGIVRSIEIYRSARAFQGRSGFIESLLMAFSKKGEKTQENEVALSTALQVLMKLRRISDETVIVQEGSDNLHIRVDELTGEAITSKQPDGTHRVIYASLGTTD